MTDEELRRRLDALTLGVAEVKAEVVTVNERLTTFEGFAAELRTLIESLRNIKLPGFLAGVIKLPAKGEGS